MASEYLKYKFKDVKRDEPVELSPAQRRKNWWHYHKWYFIVGGVLLLILVDIGANVIRQFTHVPDYRIAYVGANALPEDTARAIETGFAAQGEDLDGNGRVEVELTQYAATDDAEVAAATEVLLMGDVLECDSYFFLLEDPAAFQRKYHCLSMTGGSLPASGDLSAQGTYFSWESCPALAAMELGAYSYESLGETVSGESRDIVGTLHIARRGFWTDKTCAHPEGCGALWNKITEGATQ